MKLRILFHRLLALFFSLSLAVSASGQIPSLMGTVYHDADNDGMMGGGEGLVGVTVSLFEDDGNGIFDADVDQVITTVVTDADGNYAFGGLDPNSGYFIAQAAHTVGSMNAMASVSSLIEVGEFGFNTLIDDFKDQQRLVAHPINSVVASNLTSDGVLGGQRDLHLEYLSGPAEAVLHSNPFGMSDVLEFNQSAGVQAIATITWDGNDTDMSTTPNPGGLGGFDLTEGGLSQGFAFSFGIDAAGAGENLTLRVFSGDEVSSVSVALPVTDGTATNFQIVPFDAFLGGADFTNVDAIQLELGGVNPSIDAQIGPFGLVGPTFNNIPVVIPEPSGRLIGLVAIACLTGFRKKRTVRKHG